MCSPQWLGLILLTHFKLQHIFNCEECVSLDCSLFTCSHIAHLWLKICEHVLVYFFNKPTYVDIFFAISEKKVLDPNGPYISTFQSILRNVYLSVILEFCLLSSSSSASVSSLQPLPAYVEAWNIHQKLGYIILVDPNGAEFLVFETVFLGRSATLPYVRKINHKNERHLRLVSHILTKLSQNVCLTNIQILIYGHSRCDCKLWNAPWFYYVFWVVSYINNWLLMSELLYLHKKKHSLIVYLIDTDVSKCQMCLQVMESFLILWLFFANSAQNWQILMSEVIYLHQTFICYVFDVNINISL